MFGFKKDKGQPQKERPAFDPRSRVSLYALCGLYLGYLLYQMAGPYFKGLPSAASTPLFLLGVVVLGGGSVTLLCLAWRMYRMPVPVEEESAGEETADFSEEALPEDEAESAECEDHPEDGDSQTP